MNGFLMLFVNAVVLILAVVGIINSIIQLDASDGHVGGWMLGGCILLLIVNIIMWCGLMMLEPNEAKVTTWFGKYSGTFSQTGSAPSTARKRCRSVPATSTLSPSR